MTFSTGSELGFCSCGAFFPWLKLPSEKASSAVSLDDARRDHCLQLGTIFRSHPLPLVATRFHLVEGMCKLKTCTHNSNVPSPPLFVVTRFHLVEGMCKLKTCTHGLKTCTHKRLGGTAPFAQAVLPTDSAEEASRKTTPRIPHTYKRCGCEAAGLVFDAKPPPQSATIFSEESRPCRRPDTAL